MILREVSSKDYQKIKELFKRNKLKIISLKRWKNLWIKNPFLKNKKKWPKGWVIEENKKIVGHVGNFPMNYFLNKKSYICSVLNGWVVDKKFRSSSVLLIKKYFSQINVDFFLGTTFDLKTSKIMQAINVPKVPIDSLENSLIIILKTNSILNYFFGKKLFLFKKSIFSFFSMILFFFFRNKINYWEDKFSTKNIEKCKVIDGKFDLIWKKTRSKYSNKLLLKRDSNWLKWHLSPFLEEKKAWIFFSMKNNKINGYSISVEKMNLEKGIRSALLIDLIVFNDYEQTSKNLIGANIKEAKTRNYDLFEFRGFDQKNRAYMKFFKPFEKKLLLNPFYYKSKNKKLNKLLNNSKHWNPSYIDGDAIISF